MAIAEIYVTLKPALLDVQGATVLKSLHQLGHTHAADVRIGKYIAVTFDDALSQAEMQAHLDAMCRELLANPVIEDYRIAMSGSAAPVFAAPPVAVPSIVAGEEVPSPAQPRVVASGSIPATVTAARITTPQEIAPAPVGASALTPVVTATAVAASPSEVSTATVAAATSTAIADPFAVAYDSYSAMSTDEQLELQGLAWQQHGQWIEGELASRRATWILCVGAEVVDSGETLDSYPSDARLATLGSANDLVPWVFTGAPQD